MEEPLSSKPHIANLQDDGIDDQLNERVRSLQLPDHVTADASTSSKLAWFLCLLLAATTVIFGYLLYQQRKNVQLAAEKPAQTKATTNSAGNSSAANASQTSASSGNVAFEAKGYIIPRHQILVSPKVSGMITRLAIIESQRVKKGDILAEIEDTDYRAERDRAKAMLESARHNLAELERGYRPEEIAQAKAELAEAEAQFIQAEADYKRSSEMLARKVLSKEAYDAALSRYEATKRRVERLKYALKLLEEGPRIERINVARAQVNQAEAELAKAEWRLSNCIIRAPISGTILKKNAEEGSLVNPIALQGFFSLCEMADLSDLEVELTIQERDISKIFAGQSCKIRADAYPDRVYQGKVSRIMPTADRAKGAVPVRVKIDIPPEEEGIYLKPEMGAIVSFLKAPPQQDHRPTVKP